MKCLVVNFCQERIHDSVVVSRSIVAITIQVSGQNCVVGNNDINILKLISQVGELKFSVEKGSMHVCPKGVIERIGNILLGNFGGGFHYLCGRVLVGDVLAVPRTNQYSISEISYHCRNVGILQSLFPDKIKDEPRIPRRGVIVDLAVHPFRIMLWIVVNGVGCQIRWEGG